MDKNNSSGFVKGVTTLAIAGVICKIIGAVYRIPLTNMIGAEAMGVYSKAYLLYALLWVVSTSGLPGAISSMVAACQANGDSAGSKRIFVLARRLLLTMGLVFTAILMLFSGSIARSLGITDGAIAIICIAPSLLLSVAAAYMGYFQGKQNMLPTAITQVIGSTGKLVAGIGLALLWMDKGVVWAAAGALLGVTASELLSIVYIHIHYTIYTKKHPSTVSGTACTSPVTNTIPSSIVTTQTSRSLLAELLRKAIPITLCGAALPLLNALDAYLVTWCLHALHYSESHINAMYGVLNGMVSSLVNVPAALAVAVSTALLPFVSGIRAKRDPAGISAASALGLKLGLLLGLPCAVGMFILAEPIIGFFYPVSQAVTLEQQQLAVNILRLLCPAIIGICIMHSLTGALQGAGKARLPVISIGVGAVIKLGLGAVLLLNEQLNILGAPIASSVCFLTAGLLNFYFAKKHCGLHAGPRSFLPAVGAASVMGALCYALLRLCPSFVFTVWGTMLTVLAAALLYFLLLYLFKALTPQELAMLPFGNKKKRK